MRVRFAPSPTGHLHVGNARTALFNWLLARGQNGTFILRVEDTDLERSTRESEQRILEDLRWMGLTWDEGVEAGGDVGPYRQSERLEIYAAHTARLIESGHAYYCFCSAEALDEQRKAQLAAGLPPRYAGTCRTLAPDVVAARRHAGEASAVRLRVPADREVSFDDLVRGPVTFHTDVIGDPVIVRSDGIPAYNYAVVIDDHLMDVSHVIRGEDHISNTPRQLLVYEAFGWSPPRFAHLSLVLGPDHAPLSKRHGATSVAEFRDKGYLAEALVNYLALIGWSPRGDDAASGEGAEEILPALEMARRFRLEDVSHSAGVFDEDKLAWVNRHYLKHVPAERLVDESLPFLRAAGFITEHPGDEARAWLAMVLPPMAASIDRLDQLPDRLSTIFHFSAAATLADEGLSAELSVPASRRVVEALAAETAGGAPLVDREAFRAMAGRVKDVAGQKGRALFHPLRVAITGAGEGPELDLLVPAIERAARLPTGSGLAAVLTVGERAAAIASLLSARTA
ncbi:MAG: glutamate--tRNA ligase [Acidobacteria bacterium]|nr:glutamate--tRNA ligase [Acidobacteriota bacterium]